MAVFPGGNAFGLDSWFQFQVQQRPNAPAVVQGGTTLSYGELNQYASQLTATLAEFNITYEEPVGILIPMGVAHTAAQIAVIRLGGSCVPVDVSFPDQRLHDLLRPLGVRLVITTALDKKRVHSFQTMVISEEVSDHERTEVESGSAPFSIHTGGDHRTHVLHTSGTTSLPKPVEILSKGITRLAFNKACVEFSHHDRVAQISAPSFDVALFELWATLARGAAIVFIPKAVVIDPFALVEHIRMHGITLLALTTALINHVVSSVPNAFEGVETVMSGGEKANPEALRAILENGPPKNLLHAYGPTECTTISTYHLMTMEELEDGHAPIGKALDGTSCHILDKMLQPVKDGSVGELYIAGEGLARGYFNRAEANAKSFLHLAGLQEDDPQKLTRVYKTGDLCRYTVDRSIDFVARADDQVKLRGFRIQPGEIESVLLKCQMLEAAALVPIQRAGKDMYLTAFVIPKDSDSFSFSKLDEYMKSALEAYKIPRVELVKVIPFTVHGKIDRQALKDSHIRALEELERNHCISGSSESMDWLRNLWITTLDVHDINGESDFFDLGGSSLQAAGMIVRVRRRYGKLLSMQDIYNHSKLESLNQLIEKGTESISVDPEVPAQLLGETTLSKDFAVPFGAAPDWRAPEEGCVFLTGATGFLGSYMLRLLIDQVYVKSVHCLVRAPTIAAARQRLHKVFEKYALPTSENFDKIVVILGNLESPRYGLTDKHWQELADSVSVIFHFGAHVNYVQPYEKHRGSNVLGTLTTLAFATTGRVKPVHFTSTAAVSGPISYFRDVETVLENHPLSSFKDSLPYDLGYIQSKWVAENLIQDMISKGLPAVIYRPGFIMGDTVTGMGNSGDFMARLMLGCIMVGCRPSLSNQSKALVPVDFVAGALLHISSRPCNYRKTFHLVPQSRDEDFDMEVLWSMLARCGYPLRAVAYKDWLDALSEDGNLLSNPLLALLPALQEPVHQGHTRWELWNDMAEYDVERAKEALKDCSSLRSGLVCADLERQVQNWKQQGLLPPLANRSLV